MSCHLWAGFLEYKTKPNEKGSIPITQRDLKPSAEKTQDNNMQNKSSFINAPPLGSNNMYIVNLTYKVYDILCAYSCFFVFSLSSEDCAMVNL